MPRCPSTSLNYYFFRYWSGLDLYMTSSFYILCSKLQRMMIFDRKLYGHNQTSSWKQQNFTLAPCSMLMRTYVAIGPLFYRPSSGIPNAFAAWLQQISEGCGNLTKGWNIPNAMGKSFENELCFMESQNVSHLFHNFLAGSLLRWPNEPCTCNNVEGLWPGVVYLWHDMQLFHDVTMFDVFWLKFRREWPLYASTLWDKINNVQGCH